MVELAGFVVIRNLSRRVVFIAELRLKEADHVDAVPLLPKYGFGLKEARESFMKEVVSNSGVQCAYGPLCTDIQGAV